MNLIRTSRWVLALLAGMLSALPAADLLAQDYPDRAGYFAVRSATSTVVEDIHQLDARLQLVLSADALDALNSGVPLIIELELEVIRSRRFMPDANEAVLNFRHELEYRPLSQRYIIRNLNSGELESFSTLYSALNNLGRVQDVPIIDDTVLDPDANYRIRLRALLSTQQYPAPLRMIFFWRSQWQLKSEWFEWQLER